MKSSTQFITPLTGAILTLLLATAGPGCGGKKDGDKTQGAAKAQGGAGKAGTAGTKGGAKAGAPIPQAPSRGPEHSVYSLLDNRLAAHVLRGGGLVMLPGSAGFAKYMRFSKQLRWKIRDAKDGKRVATMTGSAGRFDLPLTPAQAKGSPALRVRLYSPDKRRLSIRINGDQKREIRLSIEPGWTTVDKAVPGGSLRAGENTVLLFVSKGAPLSVAWVQVGGAAFGDKTPRFAVKTRGGGAHLVLPEGGGLAYYVHVPEKGLLTADLDAAGCKVSVTATADGGTPVKGSLTGRGSAVDLSPLAGKVVRLELLGGGCKTTKLTRADLVVPGAAKTYARPTAKPKYVVLWIMDSLRADRVKTFVPSARPDVPMFDELAKSSALFMHTYVQGNESRSSHASIWASLYPVKHKFFTHRGKLEGKWNTIDEVAKRAKMFTSGVSANGYIRPKRGFGTKWDSYRNHIALEAGLSGRAILDKALASVDGKKEPWFLYMGTIDTHVTWKVKEPWMSKYDPKPYTGRFAKKAGSSKMDKLTLSPRDIEHIIAIYDSNVSYQDDLLKQLFTKLGEWGIADETMVIVTSDHGDEQWEKGRVGHGNSLAETLVHVPLLIHYPPLFPAGKIDEGVEVIDVLPTVADALGLPQDPEWQGESLIPLANGVGTGYPRMMLTSQIEEDHAARIGGWKIRATGGGKPQIYNLAKEPKEDKDRADRNPIARRYLSDAFWMLRTYAGKWNKRTWGPANNVTEKFPNAMGE